ncbi:MAG: Gldg family protein [Eubacteriales bacterium]|jgi:ABC-2 type transport system permease protein
MSKLNSLRRMLDTKYVRFGGYSALMCAIAIAIVIVVNLLVNALPATFTKLDTSKDKIFTISDETKEIIRSVTDDITMYLIASSGNEDDQLIRFMERYTATNPKIKQGKVDPALSPDFISKYTDEDLSENSIIVVNHNSGRAYAIDNFDIYVTIYTEEELYYYYLYGTMPKGTTSFAGEQVLTSAIDFVTEENLPTVYFTTGHGEKTVTDSILKNITSENINTDTVSLMSEGGIPEDCTVLMINTPSNDFTKEEIEMLRGYVSSGGKILLITSYAYSNLDNLFGFMAEYGLQFVEGLVVEGSMSYTYNGIPFYLMPKIGANEITDKAGSNVYIVLPNSHGIRLAEDIPATVKVTKLMTTTDSAFAKMELPEVGEIVKTDADEPGPFQLGVMATVENQNADSGRLIWFSSPDLISDLTAQIGNHKYFIATLTTLCDKQSSISIAAKSMQVAALNISDTGATIWSIIIIGIIPGLLLVAGFVRWNTRRKR